LHFSENHEEFTPKQEHPGSEVITSNSGGSFEFLLLGVCLPVPSVSDSSANCEPGGACCYGRGVRHVPFSSAESMAENFKYLGSQVGAGFIDFFFYFFH